MPDNGLNDKHGKLWTRDELILAFDLYCRIPFKVTKSNNPQVIALASALKRSPASIARKLGNFGSFDPALKKQQISGLGHTSKLDKEVWDEFHRDWNHFVLEAGRLREGLRPIPFGDHVREKEIERPTGESEREAVKKTRAHQQFFRDVVLSSYDETCCVTGLRLPDCLVASHIVPWHLSEELRTDPRNGLCFSATFDRLFDSGHLTVSADLKIVISSGLLNGSEKRINDLICVFHGKPIHRPWRFLPHESSLEWHRNNVFAG